MSRITAHQLVALGRAIGLDVIGSTLDAWIILHLHARGLSGARIWVDNASPWPLGSVADNRGRPPGLHAGDGQPVIALALDVDRLFIDPKPGRDPDGYLMSGAALQFGRFDDPLCLMGHDWAMPDEAGRLYLAASGIGMMRAHAGLVRQAALSVIQARGINDVSGLSEDDIARHLAHPVALDLIGGQPWPVLIRDWERIDWRPDAVQFDGAGVNEIIVVDDEARAQWLEVQQKKPRRLKYPRVTYAPDLIGAAA
jgi:hypothetical protein